MPSTTNHVRPSRHERGYGTRWDKARRTYLISHPLCVMCEQDGRLTPATVVDHINPHHGDQALFWNTDNWQSLCTTHHSSTKQRQEKSGLSIGCNAQGQPIDPNHPWNKV